MKFNKIKIKNIRSYKDQEIEFPEGSILLSGEVGSGKTSVLLAVEYALFGLQPGQKGASLLRNDSENGEVELELDIDGSAVSIERKLKRTLKGVSNEYASITINGEKFESSVTEIKSKIVNLLNYPNEFVKKNNILYRFTVHSPQEQMKQIILEDAETRLNTLRHIFGMDKYKRIKDNLSILVTNLKAESKLIQGEIKTLEDDKENLKLRKLNTKTIEQKIKERQLDLNDKINRTELVESELKKLKEKIEERRIFNEEIEKTKIMLANKKENLISLNKEEEETTKIIQEMHTPFKEEIYSSLLEKIKVKKEEIEHLNLYFIDVKSNITSSEKEIDGTIKKKDRIFKIDICPTCLQNVPESHKHNILNETETKITEIKKILDVLSKEYKAITEKINSQKNELKILEEEKADLDILKSKQQDAENSKNKLENIKRKKEALNKDINLLIAHIDGLKEKVFAYSTLDIHCKKKEEELKQVILEEKNTEIILAELKKEFELCQKEINLLEKIIMEKEQSKKKLNKINELIDWLSSQFLKLVELIESNVLIKLRNEFSNLFRKWFLMLIPENSLDSHIDENFTPVILQGEAEMDYDFLSGGERTAVALAYRLALTQTINSLMSKIKTKGLIILDEPTDGFSEAQISKMRDIFEELNVEQLIIVSHEQKIESFVDNVLKVSKNGDVSDVILAQTTALLK